MSGNLTDWIGRTEEARDFSALSAVDRYNATLSLDAPPCVVGAAVPLMAHWLFFTPTARHGQLGEDGHPKRGGFLPPVHDLPRRMFAGARYRFHGALPAGCEIARKSTILSVKEKEGASGRLVFVTVRHDIGTVGGPVAIEEEHDIVYRGLGGAAAKAASAAPEPGDWQRCLTPDPVLLFRYSAITFNAHRIHYDLAYAQNEEGYPGLVMQGPLIATLMLQLAEEKLVGKKVDSFAFRAMSPLFGGRKMSVNAARPDANGVVKLWACNDQGGLAMQGEAVVAP